MGAEMSLIDPTVMEFAVTPGAAEVVEVAVAEAAPAPTPSVSAPEPTRRARPQVAIRPLCRRAVRAIPTARFVARAGSATSSTFPTTLPFGLTPFLFRRPTLRGAASHRHF
jgi:hypothetical protein